jgi:hypothetical protein
MAIKQYLEFRKKEKEVKKVVVPEEVVEKAMDKIDRDIDSELKEYYDGITGLTSEIQYVDEEGNTYYEYEENPDDYAVDGLMEEDDVYEIQRRTAVNSKILSFFDEIYIDADALFDDEIDVVLKMLWKNRAHDGFYSVHLVRFGKVYTLPCKVEEFTNKEEVLNYIQACKEAKESQLANYGGKKQRT